MSRYPLDGRSAVEQVRLAVGDRVKLGPETRRWWTVQAVSEHFAACVRQAAFQRAGTLEYTVLDWRNGVRGPCDLIGQGYGDGSYSPEECAEMLADFEYVTEEDPAYIAAMAAGASAWVPSRHGVSVSQRNWVALTVVAHRAGGAR